jgi:predicted TPR repeat methyltransferase
MTTLLATANPDTLASRVQEMIDAGRIGAARPLLAALRRMGSGSDHSKARIGGLSARLLAREGRLPEAGAALDDAIALLPEDGNLRKQRAELRLQCDDKIGAVSDAADAVIFDRTDVGAKALLGIVLIELGEYADAIACLTEAVSLQPQRSIFRQALAQAQECAGDRDAATGTLRAAIALAPSMAPLRTALMLLLVRSRDFPAVIEAGEAARHDGAADACGFGLLGHALSSLGRGSEAALSYREALKLAPEDPYVRHLVSASGALPAAERAPTDYLRTVFDGYAERFELHLVSLGYRVPGLFRAEYLAHPPVPPGPVLDLGCGTGLVGLVFADIAPGPITGIDVSTSMLEQSAAKELYSHLHEAELESFLDSNTQLWSLILAGDVFCYFGLLGDVLTRVALRLVPGGRCIFNVELSADTVQPGEPCQLGANARYHHAPWHVEQAAAQAGLTVRSIRREGLRTEGGESVPGLIVMLERG